MFRTAVAILLMSSASAWAQGPQVAEDQKRLQGIWRVRDVVGSAQAKGFILQMKLTFEGNKFLALSGPEPGIEISYSLAPTKEPKQIDFVEPQAVDAGQKAPAPRPRTVAGIYAFEHDRLKLHFSEEPGNRRPTDFTGAAGDRDFVIILERDTSADARTTVKDARIVLAIRGLGAKASALDPQPGAPVRVSVKLDKTKGDALLMKIAPQVKALSRATALSLDGSKVTDAGLASLEEIDNIEHINLERTAVTDAGLEHLRQMTKLRLLNVSVTKVTEAGIAGLRKSLPRLRVRLLSRAQLDSEQAITKAGGVGESDENGRLIAIRFAARNKLNDATLLRLQKHLEPWKTTLRLIDLTNCDVTDEGLKALTGLTGLEQLTLKGTDTTVAGVKALQRSAPRLKVKH
jgi:uncharacterized protein (TIGR03067 family)